jgi:SAM-dependent methyltransferase
MKQKIKNLFNLLKLFKNLKVLTNKNLPIYTSNNNNGIKVHIGSGDINLQGWINIDARSFEHVHIVTNDISLNEFQDNSIEEIYLCHVLEHISFNDSENFIEKMYTKLRPGGILRISVPSFDSIVKIYENNNNNLDIVKYALMGGQDYEYNFHKSIYNYETLKNIFSNKNFVNINTWNTEIDFGQSIGDWSDRSFKSQKGPIKISLNIKGQRI